MITLATVFIPMARVYSFMALLSTASVIKCEIHFQLSIALELQALPTQTSEIAALALMGTLPISVCVEKHLITVRQNCERPVIHRE